MLICYNYGVIRSVYNKEIGIFDIYGGFEQVEQDGFKIAALDKRNILITTNTAIRKQT